MDDPESCPTRLENSYLKKVQYLFVVYNIKKTEKSFYKKSNEPKSKNVCFYINTKSKMLYLKSNKITFKSEVKLKLKNQMFSTLN